MISTVFRFWRPADGASKQQLKDNISLPYLPPLFQLANNLLAALQ